jgi:membrane fusion protein (multidrug efflux system)
MITDKKEQALLLPSIALIEERGIYHVFVAEGDKAIRKQVKAGYIVDDKTEIVSGISHSDQVIIKGQRNLEEGDKLNVITSSSQTNQE